MNGVDTIANAERAKYQKLWQRPEYRDTAPGERAAMVFLQQAGPPKDAEVIDFGCGTGRGGLMLALMGNMKVTLLDFTDNCLDPEVAQACETQGGRLRFIQHDLLHMPQINASYGYCTDVMEHVPEKDVDRVLSNVLASANKVFFQIDCQDDNMGVLIGEKLHLTVQPYAWWLAKLTALGAAIFWSHDAGSYCQFYCSVWKTAKDVLPTDMPINVGQERATANVIENLKRPWQQVHPHARQNTEIMILAGGPSLNDPKIVDEIRWNRTAGMPLVCVNGTYRWALERNLVPSALIILDARPECADFIPHTVPTCQYLIASQADPSVFEKLPYDRTRLWHSGVHGEAQKAVIETFGIYFPVYGGCTVVLRSIPLLRMLGFWKMHLFGFDSCINPSGHHAYPQKQNDKDQVIPVSCAGRTFECAPWMLSQAQEFTEMVGFLGDEVTLAVHGDGLIAHIIKTGASLSKELEHGSTAAV